MTTSAPLQEFSTNGINKYLRKGQLDPEPPGIPTYPWNKVMIKVQ